MFTIELESKDDVKNVSMDGNSKVLIEGSLGSLKRARFVEDLVLEVIGSNGVLRIDLGVNDLHLPPHHPEGSKGDRRSGQ